VIAVDRRQPKSGRLLAVDANGEVRHLARWDLANQFDAGDLLVANDAATLPASLHGSHVAGGETIEVRLAAWTSLDDVTRFTAIVFGAGDHRTRTEDRSPPPLLTPGDALLLGPLSARIERVLDHPRLVVLRFSGTDDTIWAGIARHAKPIQ
jgi:S-adenosylmethionine:tRNA ribosyltransferase-isomerase